MAKMARNKKHQKKSIWGKNFEQNNNRNCSGNLIKRIPHLIVASSGRSFGQSLSAAPHKRRAAQIFEQTFDQDVYLVLHLGFIGFKSNFSFNYFKKQVNSHFQFLQFLFIFQMGPSSRFLTVTAI